MQIFSHQTHQLACCYIRKTDTVFGHSKSNCYVHLNGDGAIGETDILIKVCIYINKYINKLRRFLNMYARLFCCHLLGVSIFEDLTVIIQHANCLCKNYVKIIII
jgi:hypothetical protein